ncbi:amidohydrolase family protein [bacterium]|nr:amidohydrolase family protein [bacterium]
MKYFDFNVHPKLKKATDNANDLVLSEINCQPSQILESLKVTIKEEKWSELITGFNYMLFSAYFQTNLSSISDFAEEFYYICQSNNLAHFLTLLVNPHDDQGILQKIKAMKKYGINFIKFHAYHQKIDESLFKACIEYAEAAESEGIGICVDASYGTLGLYDYDNLKLAANILKKVTKVPVIILHAGGLRAHEAALIAADSDNAYIELSFSPIYYKNTSVYERFVDLFKLVDINRLLYASDYPYIEHSESITESNHLLKVANLNATDIEKVTHINAYNLRQALV